MRWNAPKYILTTLITTVLLLVFPSLASACTYEATIKNNHLDIKITSDTNYIQLVQLMFKGDKYGAPYKVIFMYAPSYLPWTLYLDGQETYSGYSMLIQNRKQIADAAYWVSWIDSTHYRHIPAGIYGLDFSGNMTYDDIDIEYGTMDDNGNPNTVGEPWTFCTRTGNVGDSIPVTKTVFAPGITASWNADALINCNSNPTTEWTLAPYAEDVYRPLIQALQESGTNLFEFYYDWRKNPVETSQKLASMIEGKIIPDEKVNYVGHSMGGLVGKNYLDTTEGSTIANFLTIGTPYKGSALAYPPWEGGDVWSNNLLEKIAITLYLKHCGEPILSDRENIRNIVPSLQSLLPTKEYLQGKNEMQPKLPLDPDNQNNWFAGMSPNNWDVRVGNIVGKGVETLQIIQTKDPNKKEKLNGDWIDGKPAGRINSDGDGTVLATSAVLDNADEIIDLNQTHRGLVNSVEGMSAVLKFLNLPKNITSQTSMLTEEPNSALIIIGYPADFVITDQNGKSKNAKDGMVAIMNPKSGNYKLNLLSKSGNTQLIVAQFLPNGDVKYKEFNFKGIGPKFKTLKFDLQNPKEDILTP